MSVKEELQELANIAANLPDMRAETVAKARAEKMTWREIATLLGMTEHGVIKAQKLWEAQRAGAGTKPAP